MRVPKPEWVKALRDLCGPSADLFFNEQVGRWCFMIPGADGVPRAQFWGWFDQPADPATGLHPFRELDDDAMRRALHNLTVSYVGNPRREIQKRLDHNNKVFRDAKRRSAEMFADMFHERRHRILGNPLVGWTGALETPRKDGKA